MENRAFEVQYHYLDFRHAQRQHSRLIKCFASIRSVSPASLPNSLCPCLTYSLIPSHYPDRCSLLPKCCKFHGEDSVWGGMVYTLVSWLWCIKGDCVSLCESDLFSLNILFQRFFKNISEKNNLKRSFKQTCSLLCIASTFSQSSTENVNQRSITSSWLILGKREDNIKKKYIFFIIYELRLMPWFSLIFHLIKSPHFRFPWKRLRSIMQWLLKTDTFCKVGPGN